MSKLTEYDYNGYTIYSDGTIVSPCGNTLTWFDDKYVKLKKDGKVKSVNGLNLLYEVYNNEKVTRTYVVRYVNPDSKEKTKENLVLETKRGKTQKGKIFTEKTVKQIQKEYGLSKEERQNISNNINHPTISYRQLAKKYNCSVNTIERIIQGNYGQKKVTDN